MGDEGDPFVKMEDFLNTLCLTMKETEDYVRLFHTREILQLILEYDISVSFVNSIIAKAAIYIQSGIERGYFRPVNPELYGKIMFTIVHDLMETAMLYDYPESVEIVKKELIIIVRRILEK
jgi:hypothetical protein